MRPRSSTVVQVITVDPATLRCTYTIGHAAYLEAHRILRTDSAMWAGTTPCHAPQSAIVPTGPRLSSFLAFLTGGAC